MKGLAADDVSVIVPIRNESETLGSFLASLIDQQPPPREIILVDAGSTDTSVEIVEQHARTSRTIRLFRAGPAYPGRARNKGIDGACGPWIAMTDAGTIVDEAWLRELTAAAARNPDADVVFGTYEPLVRTFFDKCLAFSFVAPVRTVEGRRYRGPSTASLLLRKQVWQQLGGFPEDLRACEDLLFFDRLAQGGWRTVCAPAATVQWRLPTSWLGVFRRFRLYSLHTMKAGLFSRWQRAILLMHAAATGAIVLGLLVHPAFFAVPFMGLIARAVRSVRRHPDILATTGRPGVAVYATICAILLCIDVAAFAGVVDYIRQRGHGA